MNMQPLNSKQFCIWLKGCFDVSGEELTSKQVDIIKTQLNLLFEHEPKPIIVDISSNIPNEAIFNC